MDPQTDLTPPDISGGMGNEIALIERAIVVPPPKDGTNRSVQQSGVLTPDGKLVGDSTQEVAVIARRKGDLDEIFARQIRAFTGARAHAINHLRRNWIEGHAHRPSRTSWGELDFPALGRSLREAGLIAGGDWSPLDEGTIRAQMVQVGEALGVGFKPWEDQAGR